MGWPSEDSCVEHGQPPQCLAADGGDGAGNLQSRRLRRLSHAHVLSVKIPRPAPLGATALPSPQPSLRPAADASGIVPLCSHTLAVTPADLTSPSASRRSPRVASDQSSSTLFLQRQYIDQTSVLLERNNNEGP